MSKSRQAEFQKRLDRLSEAKKVAQLASVLGREFPYPLVEAVAELPPEALDTGLAQLVDGDILVARRSDGESVYAFKHALLQDTAYESQLKRRRRELHARVARILEERFPGRATAEPEELVDTGAGAETETAAETETETGAETETE